MRSVEEIKRHYQREFDRDRERYARMAEQARADRDWMAERNRIDRITTLCIQVFAAVIGAAIALACEAWK